MNKDEIINLLERLAKTAYDRYIAAFEALTENYYLGQYDVLNEAIYEIKKLIESEEK